MKDGRIFLQGGVEEIFLQAEKLFDANLDLPQITKLFIELKKRSICQSTDVYTVGYAKKEIEKITFPVFSHPMLVTQPPVKWYTVFSRKT